MAFAWLVLIMALSGKVYSQFVNNVGFSTGASGPSSSTGFAFPGQAVPLPFPVPPSSGGGFFPQVQGTKPGSCPMIQPAIALLGPCPSAGIVCSSDNACPGSQKCCSRLGCQLCTDISNTNPGLAMPGTGFMLPPTVASKPGRCPANQATAVFSSTCTASCFSDSGCPGNLKCCQSGCNQMCRTPTTAGTGPVRVKQGSCPTLSPNTVGTCVAECNPQNGDADCPGTAKCCSNGCGTVCTSPRLVTARPSPVG